MKDEMSSHNGSNKSMYMKGKVGGTSQKPIFKDENIDDLSFMRSAFQSEQENE